MKPSSRQFIVIAFDAPFEGVVEVGSIPFVEQSPSHLEVVERKQLAILFLRVVIKVPSHFRPAANCVRLPTLTARRHSLVNVILCNPSTFYLVNEVVCEVCDMPRSSVCILCPLCKPLPCL